MATLRRVVKGNPDQDYTIALFAARQAYAISAFRYVREQKPRYIFYSCPSPSPDNGYCEYWRIENIEKSQARTHIQAKCMYPLSFFFFYRAVSNWHSFFLSFFFWIIFPSFLRRCENYVDGKYPRMPRSRCHCFFFLELRFPELASAGGASMHASRRVRRLRLGKRNYLTSVIFERKIAEHAIF